MKNNPTAAAPSLFLRHACLPVKMLYTLSRHELRVPKTAVYRPHGIVSDGSPRQGQDADLVGFPCFCDPLNTRQLVGLTSSQVST